MVVLPAILILWIPLGFRTACYYYRKACYRFAGPPAARSAAILIAATKWAVHPQNSTVSSSTSPSSHVSVDALTSFHVDTGWRIGLGGLILTVNVALLTGYSLSCHSLRHLVGGRIDCFSCTRRTQVRHGLWQRLTSLNRHHMAWAWASLLTVTFADIYVRLLATGVIVDPAILF